MTSLVEKLEARVDFSRGASIARLLVRYDLCPVGTRSIQIDADLLGQATVVRFIGDKQHWTVEVSEPALNLSLCRHEEFLESIIRAAVFPVPLAKDEPEEAAQ